MTEELAGAEVAVITGLSGAGRSEAAKAVEDLGWFVVDNLPPQLMKTLIKLALAPGNDIERLALVIDARGGTFFSEAMQELDKLRHDGINYRLVFLEASDEVLVRRFEASRRRHPMATEDRVAVGIQRERDVMGAFREGADLILDTTNLSVRDLRRRMAAYFEAAPGEGLKTTVMSFGYKFGLPLDADIVLDVRFLPNPHWVEGLRDLSGLDEPVRDYVLEKEACGSFIDRTKALFALLLPGYLAEGRQYLTVAIGCTGGRHRSVVLAHELSSFISEEGYPVKVLHRDVERDTTRT